MKRLKIYSFFLMFILISPLSLILIPYSVSAEETVYLDENFDDGEYSPLAPNSASFWEIVSFGGHIHTAHEKRTNNGPAYLSAYWSNVSSYEISMSFYVEKMNTGPLVLVSVGTTASDTSHSLTVRISKCNNVDDGGYLLVNGENTTKFVTNNAWHTIFVNVTNTNRAYYALDSDPLSINYITDSASSIGYIFFGSPTTNNNHDFYIDDLLAVSRLGELPIADFTFSPESGDGLTNFIFLDNSTFDNIPFENIIFWDFGDGNYTYGTPGGPVNHTYIHEGTYQVILNASNRLGYDLAYTNITITAINIGIGGEEITDDMFGFIALLAMITALNLYAMKSSTGLLSIFALMGLIVSAGLLWPDSPITTALLLVTVLGNIAITIKTVT